MVRAFEIGNTAAILRGLATAERRLLDFAPRWGDLERSRRLDRPDAGHLSQVRKPIFFDRPTDNPGEGEGTINLQTGAPQGIDDFSKSIVVLVLGGDVDFCHAHGIASW